MTTALAEVGDYVRKDGELVMILRVDEPSRTYYTSDGGCMGFEEIGDDDILLESEVDDAARFKAKLAIVGKALENGKNICRTCSYRHDSDRYPCHSCSVDDKRCKESYWEPMDWLADALAALSAGNGQ